MTPAEMLASSSPRLRRRGQDLLRDRVKKAGMSRDEALSTPVGPRGGPRPQSTNRRSFGEDSLDEIGNALGVSKERVRQIERDALAKLRKALEREGLDVNDVRAWLDTKARGANEPASDAGAPSYLRRTEREQVPEELVRERRARDTKRIEREVDAMVREIRETAAAHRFVERVCCGMEEGGQFRVLEDREAA